MDKNTIRDWTREHPYWTEAGKQVAGLGAGALGALGGPLGALAARNAVYGGLDLAQNKLLEDQEWGDAAKNTAINTALGEVGGQATKGALGYLGKYKDLVGQYGQQAADKIWQALPAGAKSPLAPLPNQAAQDAARARLAAVQTGPTQTTAPTRTQGKSGTYRMTPGSSTTPTLGAQGAGQILPDISAQSGFGIPQAMNFVTQAAKNKVLPGITLGASKLGQTAPYQKAAGKVADWAVKNPAQAANAAQAAGRGVYGTGKTAAQMAMSTDPTGLGGPQQGGPETDIEDEFSAPSATPAQGQPVVDDIDLEDEFAEGGYARYYA